MDGKVWAKNGLKTCMWLAIVLVALFLIAFALVYLNKEKIKSAFVKEINTSLTTEIQVNQIDVTFLSTFPNVALTFNDVLACDAYEGETSRDTLFFFHRLYLAFDLWDILKGSYNIKKIKAQDGEFNMKIRHDGKENYIFWKTGDTTKTNSFNLRLQAIELNNTTYTYRNDCTHQYYKILITNGYADGNFYESIQKIKLDADAVLQTIQADNLVFANNLPVTLALNCSNDTEIGKLEMKDSRIEIGKMKFETSGHLNYKVENFIDVALSGREISIKQLISLLPKSVSLLFKDYASSGNLVFKSTIKGRLDKRNVPAINSDFAINNGSLSNKKLGVTLSKINLTGKFFNGKGIKNAVAQIEVNKFSAQFCNGLVSGSFVLQDFSKLNFAAKLNADLDLENLQKMLQIKNIEIIRGNFKCSIEAKGNLNRINTLTKNITLDGEAGVVNLSLKIKDLDYDLSKTNASFTFSNQKIDITKCDGLLNRQQFVFSGSVINPLEYAFGNKNLYSITGNMQLAAFEYHNKDQKTKDTTINIRLQNIKTDLKLTNAAFIFNNLSFNAFDGQIGGNVTFVKNTKTGYDFVGTLNLAAVDMSAAFKAFNNFGQSSLTHNNIKGKLSAKADINIAFDENKNVISDKISLSTTYRIENGGLHSVAFMKKLSYFVEEKALEDVDFATLESSLQIKDGVISFEYLNVVSNALSFDFFGKHNIKNESIDYRFAIKMSELASKKKKAKLQKEQHEFGTFEEDKNARLTLFVKVGGTLEKPQFSYDMKRNMQQAKQILKKDSQKIASQINKDLQINTEQNYRDKEQWRKQSKGEWVIDWEETPKDTATLKPQNNNSPDLIIEW